MDFASDWVLANDDEENDYFDEEALVRGDPGRIPPPSPASAPLFYPSSAQAQRMPQIDTSPLEVYDDEDELSDDEYKPEITKKKLRHIRKVDTNICAVNLGSLAKEASLIFTGDPTICEGCEAVFSQDSVINDLTWICEYCQHRNDAYLDPHEIPKGDTIDYMLSPAPPTSTNDSTIVFCIDISAPHKIGSMCITTEVSSEYKVQMDAALNESLSQFIEQHNGVNADQWLPGQRRDVGYVSRLQCVKSAILGQIDSLKREHPNKRLAIVTFANDVTIYLANNVTHTIAGDKLYDRQALLSTALSLGLDTFPPVKSVHEDFENVVKGLQESGATALGPGLLVSIGLASAAGPGSSIVLCTDGVANIGLGSLDTKDSEVASQFYADTASEAVQRGVMVSVVSIKGSNTSLEHIAKVANITKGYNDVLDPLSLTEGFNYILENTVVATDVEARMRLHKGLKFRGETEVNGGVATRIIGTVAKETTISFKYDVSRLSMLKGVSEIPFQIKILYTRLDGSKCLRVISKVKKVTADRKKAETGLNVNVVGIFSQQKAAQLAAEGNYTKARMVQKSGMRLARRGLEEDGGGTEKQKKQLSLWNTEATRLNQALKKTKISEQERGLNYDSASDDSDSEDELFEEMEASASSDGKKKRKKKSLSSKSKAKFRNAERFRSRTENDDLSNVIYQAANPMYSHYTSESNPLYKKS